MKIRSAEAQLFYANGKGKADGQTDRQTDMTKLIVAFRSFAKAHKINWSVTLNIF